MVRWYKETKVTAITFRDKYRVYGRSVVWGTELHAETAGPGRVIHGSGLP